MPRTAAGAVPKFSPPGAACIIAKFDFGKMKLNLRKPHIPEIFGKDIISPLKLRCNGGGLRDIRRAFPDAPPVPIAPKTFGRRTQTAGHRTSASRCAGAVAVPREAPSYPAPAFYRRTDIPQSESSGKGARKAAFPRVTDFRSPGTRATYNRRFQRKVESWHNLPLPPLGVSKRQAARI